MRGSSAGKAPGKPVSSRAVRGREGATRRLVPLSERKFMTAVNQNGNGHKAAQPIVNDVTITVATSNGTGSQSANLILMRSILGMGIPVSGKNMFPSNIQGLPTWF